MVELQVEANFISKLDVVNMTRWSCYCQKWKNFVGHSDWFHAQGSIRNQLHQGERAYLRIHRKHLIE